MRTFPRRILDAIGRLPDSRPASAVLLAAACAVAYAGSPANGFVLDDHQIVLENPLVTQPGRAHEAFVSPYQGESRNDRLYRPIPVVSLAVQWALHGADPAPFHAANVALHVAATLLAWALARALLPGWPAAGLLAGLLFAVHPIHTDAVSSVVNRSEVLAAAFAIAGFLSWRRWLRGGRSAWLAAAGASYLAAILSKESGAPLLAFAAAWAVPSSHRSRGAGRTAVAWAVAFVLPAAAYLALRANALDGQLVAATHRYFGGVDVATTVRTMAGVGARYLALLVVPFPLSADYSYESIPLARSVLEPWTLAGMVALPALAIGTVALLARRSPGARGAGFGLLWFWLFVSPAANVVPLLIPMAERILYTATAGAFASVAAAAEAAVRAGGVQARARRIAAGVAAAVVVAALGAATAARERVWHDDVSLSADVVSSYPRNALMWANLGAALATDGRAAAAVGAFRNALDVAPGKWEFRVALAGILHESGLHADEASVLADGLGYGPRPEADVRRVCVAMAEADPTVAVEDCVAGRRPR